MIFLYLFDSCQFIFRLVYLDLRIKYLYINLIIKLVVDLVFIYAFLRILRVIIMNYQSRTADESSDFGLTRTRIKPDGFGFGLHSLGFSGLGSGSGL